MNDKKQFLLDDEMGMMGMPQKCWPTTNRCPYCGRFLKKRLGLWGIIQHWNNCSPYQNKKDKPIKDALLEIGSNFKLTPHPIKPQFILPETRSKKKIQKKQ